MKEVETMKSKQQNNKAATNIQNPIGFCASAQTELALAVSTVFVDNFSTNNSFFTNNSVTHTPPQITYPPSLIEIAKVPFYYQIAQGGSKKRGEYTKIT
jgi:hypothetical protein